jgi:hypothetical protein
MSTYLSQTRAETQMNEAELAYDVSLSDPHLRLQMPNSPTTVTERFRVCDARMVAERANGVVCLYQTVGLGIRWKCIGNGNINGFLCAFACILVLRQAKVGTRSIGEVNNV